MLTTVKTISLFRCNSSLIPPLIIVQHHLTTASGDVKYNYLFSMIIFGATSAKRTMFSLSLSVRKT